MSPRSPAFLPGPGMAVYYASKAYVLSFSEALHRELSTPRHPGHGALPGPGTDRIPGPLGDAVSTDRKNLITLTADRVAQIGYDGFMRGKRVVDRRLANKIAVALHALHAACACCCRSSSGVCAPRVAVHNRRHATFKIAGDDAIERCVSNRRVNRGSCNNRS